VQLIKEVLKLYSYVLHQKSINLYRKEAKNRMFQVLEIIEGKLKMRMKKCVLHAVTKLFKDIDEFRTFK
jgi:phosphosulfolactate synthase (CoM biosynthesis protein A)